MNSTSLRSYSQKVELVKKLLLFILAMLVCGVTMAYILKPRDNMLQISYAVEEVDGGKMKLTRPQLYGADGKKQVFGITADSGVRLDGVDEVVFNNVSGHLNLSRQGGAVVSLLSNHCSIDMKNNLVDLSDDVELRYDEQYAAHTKRAFISLKSNGIWTNEHIEIEGVKGSVKADSFYFDNNTHTLTFVGNVKTVIE